MTTTYLFQDSTISADISADTSVVLATENTPRVGPPDTSYHMKLSYVVSAVMIMAYVALLVRRVLKIRKQS